LILVRLSRLEEQDTPAQMQVRILESISNRAYAAFFQYPSLIDLHSRIPADEGLPDLLIEHLRPHLEKIVRPGLAPSHLLLRHHALAHHLIHRGPCEGR